MNLLSYTVVKSKHGPDYVFINTDLPQSEFPFNGTLVLKFTCAKGTAEEYVKTNFPQLKQKIA